MGSGLTAPISVPRDGVSDLLVSWVLAAMLIPLFVFGHARLGRYGGHPASDVRRLRDRAGNVRLGFGLAVFAPTSGALAHCE